LDREIDKELLKPYSVGTIYLIIYSCIHSRRDFQKFSFQNLYVYFSRLVDSFFNFLHNFWNTIFFNEWDLIFNQYYNNNIYFRNIMSKWNLWRSFIIVWNCL